MKYLEKVILFLTLFLTSFSIASGVLLAFVNVVARFVFNKGLEWAFELTSYLFIASAFFGAAYLFRNGGHIRVTLLIDNLPPLLAKGVVILANLLTLFYLFLVAYFSYVFIFDPDLGLRASGEVSVDLGVQMWIVYMILPVSAVFAFILSFFRLVENIKTPASNIALKDEKDMIIEEVKENLVK
ncbi:MAG: TRAP transporter small permease [Epsilonproteobacteria bacterium]|nr:TRAP transporter small permease [Campylobacterota bacterium]